MQPSSESARRVTKARSHLLSDRPFYGFQALRLKIVEDPSCKGMWTDAETLGFNPDYVATLLDIELKGLIAVTVFKITAGHPWRQGKREAVRWNKACEQAVHPLIVADGFVLPAGVVDSTEYASMSAEFIYQKLSAEDDSKPPQPKAKPGSEPGGAEDDGAALDPSSTGPEEPGDDKEGGPSEVRPAPSDKPALEAESKLAVSTGTAMEDGMSSGIESIISETMKSRVDWRSVLQNFVEISAAEQDYTMTKLNRNFLYTGLMLPGMRGTKMRSLVVVRDSSGSVGQTYRELFNGELLDIIAMLNPEELVIIDADSAVCKVQHLSGYDIGENFDPNIKGGGGTSFIPAFEYVDKEQIDCACLIYLTDLDGRFPSAAPDYPVLWAVPEGSHRQKKPPFGEVLELTLN